MKRSRDRIWAVQGQKLADRGQRLSWKRGLLIVLGYRLLVCPHNPPLCYQGLESMRLIYVCLKRNQDVYKEICCVPHSENGIRLKAGAQRSICKDNFHLNIKCAFCATNYVLINKRIYAHIRSANNNKHCIYKVLSSFSNIH